MKDDNEKWADWLGKYYKLWRCVLMQNVENLPRFPTHISYYELKIVFPRINETFIETEPWYIIIKGMQKSWEKLWRCALMQNAEHLILFPGSTFYLFGDTKIIFWARVQMIPNRDWQLWQKGRPPRKYYSISWRFIKHPLQRCPTKEQTRKELVLHI